MSLECSIFHAEPCLAQMRKQSRFKPTRILYLVKTMILRVVCEVQERTERNEKALNFLQSQSPVAGACGMFTCKPFVKLLRTGVLDNMVRYGETLGLRGVA